MVKESIKKDGTIHAFVKYLEAKPLLLCIKNLDRKQSAVVEQIVIFWYILGTRM